MKTKINVIFSLKKTDRPNTTKREFRPYNPSLMVCLLKPSPSAIKLVNTTPKKPQKPNSGFKKVAIRISIANTFFFEKNI